MADIFISYSSKDRAQAEQLTELLASAGLSVWIDKQGIDAAASWSGEISKAIEECKALVLLLSPTSIESENVRKEVSLAAERKKKILPLDLEPVSLPHDFAYHLAGIQRTAMTNIDSIIRALGRLGLEATQAPTLKLVKETDLRKSLMILPFEDLSPTADNGWFTDGIVSELIQALSNVKSLRLMDAQTTKEFKSYKGHLTIYAKEMGVRYFVQGDVRKFGDNIKINSRLLDIETGDHLWQDSLKGTMVDIFDIQEKVAEKVLEGLKIHLAPEEKQKLTERGTVNAEAYELYLKGYDYFNRHTKNDFERALPLVEESARLDPGSARVHAAIALITQSMYRYYSRTPALLDRADEAAERVREIEGETAQYAWVKSMNARSRNDLTSALQYARLAIEIAPDFALGYDVLGSACQSLGDAAGAVRAWDEYVRLRPSDRVPHFNLIAALHTLPTTAENQQKIGESAERALPVFERHVRLNPDDYNTRVDFANILLWAGYQERALVEAGKLSEVPLLDGYSCYNLACLYLDTLDIERGLSLLRRSITNGFLEIENFRRDTDLDPVRGTPEFEELMKELEAKIAKEQHG